MSYNIFRNYFYNLLEKMIIVLPGLLMKLFLVILLLMLVPKINNLFVKFIDKLTDKRKMDPLLNSFLKSTIKAVLYISAAIFVIEELGITSVSIMAILGTAGLAIGLALQGSLSNMAGGLVILFCKQFAKGDYISTGLGVEGTVKSIYIFYTELETPQNQAIIIPNGQLANTTITNFSAGVYRRIDLTFSASYNDSTDKVLAVLNKIADEHPKISKNEVRTIRVTKLNASSVDYLFRVWVKRVDYFDTIFDCNEKVVEEFNKNGIEIPYKKVDIYNKVV